MLHLVWGKHSVAEAIQFFQAVDGTCATRWLSYFDPSVELQVPVADLPRLKHVIEERRSALFGDEPKRYAIVCNSKSSEDYFFGFWLRYYPCEPDDQRCFCNLEEAYDWLGLSEAGRAAVDRAIAAWRAERAEPERVEPEPDWVGAGPDGGGASPVQPSAE